MTEPLVRLRSITKTFDSAKLSGIHDVNLDIYVGDFAAVIGPSGAGKSTLLNVLGLLDQPDEGSYLLDGVEVMTLSESQRDTLRSRTLGFIFQSAFALGDDSALRNAALGLQIQGVPLVDRAARASEALRTLGLRDRAGTAAKLLSGGERQRLAIARAAATRPLLILADEPTGNLDSKNGAIVMDYLRALNEQGTTVLIVTHDIKVAEMARRIFEVRDGHVAEHPRELNDRNASMPARPPFLVSRIHHRVLDELTDALSAMSRQVRRTVLLALVFALGTAALVGAIGISSSASEAVSSALTNAAQDEVRVGVPGAAQLFAPDNHELATWIHKVSRLPHVETVAYYAAAGGTSAEVRRLSLSEEPSTYNVIVASASASYLSILGSDSSPRQAMGTVGSLPTVQAAVVGSGAAAHLGVAPPAPGSALWVNNQRLSVVGLVQGTRSHPELARSIFVSPNVMSGLHDVGVYLIIKTSPGFASAVSKAVPLAMDAGNPGSFSVETVADLNSLRAQVSSDLSTLVSILSVVLLALAAVTAAATLQLSVRGRTQEIALRRALGSGRWSIARLFIVEGMLVGLAGGMIGALLGTITTILVARVQAWVIVVPPQLVPVGLVAGAVVGTISAMLPAWGASRQQPALAIRG